MQTKSTKSTAQPKAQVGLKSKPSLAKNSVNVNKSPSDDFDIIVKPSNKAVSTEPTQLYFTEKDLSRILSNLDTLRNDVYPSILGEEEGQKPSSRRWPGSRPAWWLPRPWSRSAPLRP